MTAIGKTIRILGDVVAAEELEIEGKIEGTVRCHENHVLIAPEGVVRGDLEAAYAEIDGHFTGNIVTTDGVALGQSAVIEGNILAPRVSMIGGCVFNGSIETRPAPRLPRPSAAASSTRVVSGRGGLTMPALGLGTWQMGQDPSRRADEVTAIGLGLDLGMTLIDTAEEYANGGSEQVVGEAIVSRRDEVFVVTKVSQGNASRHKTIECAEQSLRRLGTDRIDLYLLHDPPKQHPLQETYEAFEELRVAGKVLHYGVSNFHIDLLQESEQIRFGDNISCNQLKYALSHRALEEAILPWSESHDVSIMAYSPLDVGRLGATPELESVAERHEVTPMCIAIAWAIRHPRVSAIPKAANPAHVRDNARALSVVLCEEDLAELDRAYPRPPPGSFDGVTAPAG